MSRPSLRLLREARIADLLGASGPAAGRRGAGGRGGGGSGGGGSGGGGRGRFEASGVLVDGDAFLVVADNLGVLAVLDPRLEPGPANRAVPLTGGRGVGYEDLARDPVTGRLFVLIESLPGGPPFRAGIEEYDAEHRLVAAAPLDFPLERANKGIEGLGCVRRGGRLHLLGLGEDAPGRGGRIPVFVEGVGLWKRVATIRLPAELRFDDYAGLAVAGEPTAGSAVGEAETGGVGGERIAVVSQESSALWVGRLHPTEWSVLDAGITYLFPRNGRDRPRYRHVEGVSWLDADRIVVVTDRAKRGAPGGHEHDESIAVFAVPR